jgi:hypothetical protein
MCGREAVNPERPGALCPTHHPDHDPDEPSENPELEGGFPPSNPGGSADTGPSSDAVHEEWRGVDFSTVEADTYPPALLDREQWMGRLADAKRPFAPWGDRDHPEADDDKDARYKWGLTENYVDGETVGMAEADDRLDGRIFIQRDSDPFAFVDGDDVRDPDTGAVHPEFVRILDALGTTYADVSTSGAGVHAYYEADLPDGQGQAVFEIDTEPWGANDDPPTVEIYANKHVCVTTGEHVAGTPEDVHQWDSDAVKEILDEYDALKDTEPIDHDTDQNLNLGDHQPEATTSEESTTDARDIALAVDRLRPSDLSLRTRQVGTDATGWEQWDPSTYRTSSGNDSLHRPPSEAVFHDHKHGEAFGVLSLFAAEEGIISKPWDRLAGGDWWDAVDAAREAGAPIPEYDGPTADAEAKHTAVLPPAVRDLSTATSGWDWKHAARTDYTLTVDDARQRTTDAIADAYESYDQVLVEALPTMGKSYGAVKAAADTGEAVTILTGRGRKEQYQQFKDWAAEHDLDVYTLPAFTHDCDTANGEHGEEWAETVRDWYHRGATPKEIHKSAEYVTGEPLPCQQYDGQRCPYASKWDFDPDDFDVLIGHYAHAHKSKVTKSRTVVFDEFTDAYESTLTAMQGAVSYWLSTVDALPYDDYTDLLGHRSDEQRRAEALAWFDQHGVEPDETPVFDEPTAHADAPLAVYAILAGEGLGNGFERATFDDDAVTVFNRDSGAVTVLRPPDLGYTSGIVALDGTPTKKMWELSLGERLTHRPVLQDGERTEYIREALNLNFVRSSDYIKSYNSPDHVAVEKDATLLETIADEHGQAPALITTSTAKAEYDDAGVLDLVDDTKHYGDILGSNEFADTRLGAVIGSNHYGDGFIKKWGAYDGSAVERNGEKGKALSYGSFGDDVLRHMREHDTLQAAMRFGRDGNGAVVYVHTDTLPEWVPLAGEAQVVSTWSDGMKQVVDALADLGDGTTADLAAHPAVDLSDRQVRGHLDTLRQRGVVHRERDTDDGRRLVWREAGIDRLGTYGEADLNSSEEFDPPDVSDLESCGSTAYEDTYTWEFRKHPSDTPSEQSGATATGVPAAGNGAGGDGPPPNPGD